ncbi:molybdopterin binding oxidoreductase [Parathielavia appendiculata]|uniref:Molybdopterin binding oxidoreductase n=1 Tax=Parathielavia appendiculata TaxID=2587402 RepID=A0AAN6TTW3_9PEZI|nr:molybdopterin binding oxidoreductase [Parathielavia appendiculata]
MNEPQGLEPGKLALRNQSDITISFDSSQTADPNPDDPAFVVEEERPSWHGYVEAHKRFIRYKFPPPPELQLGPLPPTNPVLEGNVPEESWEIVQKAPKHLLNKDSVTPNELHFVRNYGGIPTLGPGAFDLCLDELVNYPQKLTLADLQDESKFPRSLAEGPISTALWSGISLKKVIKYCEGLKDGGKHIELYGADSYLNGGAPRVGDEREAVAWIHGAPLRAVVNYGLTGARNVKWLYRIKAIEKPSRAPVQSREYLYFQQQYGKHNQLPHLGIQVQEMPVTSAIMMPWHKEVVVHKLHIEVAGKEQRNLNSPQIRLIVDTQQGWAYSGGGRWPERVKVSSDGGWAWYQVPPENLSAKHKWTWRTWSISVPCDQEGWTELVVRCWDNSLNIQQMEVRHSWNWGLHVTSSCHRIRKRLAEFEEHKESFVPITRPTEFKTMSLEEYNKVWANLKPRDVDD